MLCWVNGHAIGWKDVVKNRDFQRMTIRVAGGHQTMAAADLYHRSNFKTAHEKAEENKKLHGKMIGMVLDAREETGGFMAKYFVGYDPIFDRFLPETTISKPKK